MKTIFKVSILLVCLSICFLCFPHKTRAQNIEDATAGLNVSAKKANLTDGSANPSSISSTIGKIINLVLSLLGIVFLILTIYGGFLWMTASGNDTQVEKAKNIIVSAVIGLALVFSAYAITHFVVSNLQKNL